jgi:hypothetical protein
LGHTPLNKKSPCVRLTLDCEREKKSYYAVIENDRQLPRVQRFKPFPRTVSKADLFSIFIFRNPAIGTSQFSRASIGTCMFVNTRLNKQTETNTSAQQRQHNSEKIRQSANSTNNLHFHMNVNTLPDRNHPEQAGSSGEVSDLYSGDAGSKLGQVTVIQPCF